MRRFPLGYLTIESLLTKDDQCSFYSEDYGHVKEYYRNNILIVREKFRIDWNNTFPNEIVHADRK